MKKGKIGKRYRAGMAAWFLLKQCRNILRLIEPYLYLLFLNHVLTEGNLEILPVLFAGYIGVFFCRGWQPPRRRLRSLPCFRPCCASCGEKS